jgi:polyhydroxybutyrate depolymerase
MRTLPLYVLYTSILAALAAGCSEANEAPSQESDGGSETTEGQSTSGEGGLTASDDPATTGDASTSDAGSGVGGNSGGAASGGTADAGGGIADAGGSTATDGAVATGSADAGGSGRGGQPAPGCGNAAAPKGARNLTIQVNGKARTYVLFVPNGYDPKKSIPLIFAWHSAGADGAESRRYYKLEPVTGDGAIIVYPDGLNGAWDLAADGIDMKFFDALLASISKEYCVDQARVFSTGYSFGGMMSNSLACSRGSKLRAFAPMAGAFFDGTKSCATPVPAWIAHGSDDPTVRIASGQAARDIWLKTNGCGTTSMPTSPSPCVAYQCSKAPVHWCVHTNGHVWPNFASKGVWAFFSSL